MSSNTYGRQVVIPLTNKSGGSVAAGDVVIVDTGNNNAFTTTTSAGFTGGVGIAQETIASNAVGRVLIGGYAALVNVSASVTRGHFGATHTVAKQAASAGASRGVGTFCQFLTGGTTPDALMYPVDLLGSSLTNPMTTKGDIILGNTGGTPVRLAAGTSGYILTAAGAGNYPAWAAAPSGFPTHGYAVVDTDEGTTSGSFGALATAGPIVTITVNTIVRVTIAADMYGSVANCSMNMGVALSSSNTVAADEKKKLLYRDYDSNGQQGSRTFYMSGLTPGSTVFTCQYYHVGSGTSHWRYRQLLVECMD